MFKDFENFHSGPFPFNFSKIFRNLKILENENGYEGTKGLPKNFLASVARLVAAPTLFASHFAVFQTSIGSAWQT